LAQARDHCSIVTGKLYPRWRFLIKSLRRFASMPAQMDQAEPVVAARRLPAMCVKTKMCRFNILGACSRGQDCRFAHDRAQLERRPDLRRTKMCPDLISTGSCRHGGECTYAHDKGELRKFPLQKAPRMVQPQDHRQDLKVTVATLTPGPLPPTAVSCVTLASDDGVDKQGSSWFRQRRPIGLSVETSTAPSDGSSETPSPIYSEDASYWRQASPQSGDKDGNPPVLWGRRWSEATTTDSCEAWGAETLSRQTSASTDCETWMPSTFTTEESLEVAAPQEVLTPKVKRNRLHKTKLCSFHLAGKCRKRGSCNFAHSVEEVQALPDFSRTKLCPVVLAGGACQDALCRFAHNQEELRNNARAETLPLPSKEEVPAGGVAAGAAPRPSTKVRLGGVPFADDSSSVVLKIKNTFIDVETVVDFFSRHRARSAPGRVHAYAAASPSASVSRVRLPLHALPTSSLKEALAEEELGSRAGAVGTGPPPEPSTPPARGQGTQLKAMGPSPTRLPILA